MSKNEIDMINGSLADKLIKVAVPLGAISILQQLFNAADVWAVGKFGSDTALSAVGANVTIVNMFLTFFAGLATGGNVCLSMMIGKGHTEKISEALHTVMALGFISAICVVAIGQVIAEPLLRWMNTPEEIMSQAELYLRIYLVAMMFAVIYNFASAILRSKGDTRRPLIALIISGVMNVILNLFFVIVCKLDVAGVAIATVISNAFGAAITLGFLMREEGSMRFSFKKLCLKKEHLLFSLRIGLPTGVQGMLFSVSNMIIQSGINSFGPDSISGNTISANFEYITYFVVNAFGQTATTFVSQNYGAGRKDRCRKTIRWSMLFAISLSLIVGLMFLLGSKFWIGLFTSSASVYEYAYVRMKLVVVLEFMTAFNEMGAAALRGRGIIVSTTIISISGSCILRIIWMNTLFKWFYSIDTLMAVYPVSWAFLAVCMLVNYVWVLHRENKI